MTSDAYTESWLVGPHATRFYARTYPVPSSQGPPKALLVFVHGYTEHIGRYTEAHAKLAQRGIVVFAFDQRGFGKTALDEDNKSPDSSYGKTSSVNQLDDVCGRFCVRRTRLIDIRRSNGLSSTHPRCQFPALPIFLCGHSMGGGEVLNYAVQRDTSCLSGIIACSPLVLTSTARVAASRLSNHPADVDQYTVVPSASRDFYDAFSHDPVFNAMCTTDPLHKAQGTLRGISDMLDAGEDLLRENYKKWLKSLPVLFLHGTGDNITSCAATKELYDKMEGLVVDRAMITYPDGFHELVQEPSHREKVIEDMVAFVQARARF
ncbi:Alpha/Beta hydrolase protein [Roridomyces roridus]|uniref:Alpha/Beta hydrolase protein n=1 Tax=Roridomyces roridus TaxID=1738132 RepID=A0AAD7B030_9AGAR|nr:Alpha/Beta hydrolase protein [Roridomyces roridus]